jgi:hypothetical protein
MSELEVWWWHVSGCEVEMVDCCQRGICEVKLKPSSVVDTNSTLSRVERDRG